MFSLPYTSGERTRRLNWLEHCPFGTAASKGTRLAEIRILTMSAPPDLLFSLLLSRVQFSGVSSVTGLKNSYLFFRVVIC